MATFASIRDALGNAIIALTTTNVVEYRIGTRLVRRSELRDLSKEYQTYCRLAQDEAGGDSMTSIGVYGGPT